MRAITILIALIAMRLSADACLNLKRTGLNGNQIRVDHYPTKFTDLENAMKKDLAAEGGRMEHELRTAVDVNGRSDYAVALLYLGRNSEAVEILKRLEADNPGEYFLAANLGTAYELAGKNTEALRWIREGIRRNPESHEGTEWLHARILEAKIKQEQDPTYFDHHTILDLNPASIEDSISAIPAGAATNDLVHVRTAILYQLKERLQFVKPPDAPVAGLLFDLSMLEAGTDSLEPSARVMRLAQSYGYSHAKLAAKLEEFESKISRRQTKDTGRLALAWGTAIAMLAGLSVAIRWLFRFVRSFTGTRPPPIPPHPT